MARVLYCVSHENKIFCTKKAQSVVIKLYDHLLNDTTTDSEIPLQAMNEHFWTQKHTSLQQLLHDNNIIAKYTLYANGFQLHRCTCTCTCTHTHLLSKTINCG